MMFGTPDNAPSNTARIPSIVILGADALLAALPATPIQLAHACMQAGYQHVIPASWGDELIAAATLRELRNHSHAPAIQCSCPLVANRLLAVGTDLRPFLISLVAPPVALARYLRNTLGQRRPRITYVGRCPGAADESIDARLTPEELLATLADHAIDVGAQPEVFDSVIPPDRRRYRSQPGGLPSAELLWSTDTNLGAQRTLVELGGDELPVELAQQLLAGKSVLIDVAPKLGCLCSGASAEEKDPSQARARLTALEPPRATSPVIDEGVGGDVVMSLPASPRNVIDIVAGPAPRIGAGAEHPKPNDSSSVHAFREDSPSQLVAAEEPPMTSPWSLAGNRRYSPARGVARLMGGGLPTARDAGGRQLPRTYVARRRSPGRASARQMLDVEAPIPTATETVNGTGGSAHRFPPHDSMIEAPLSDVPMPALEVPVPEAAPEPSTTRFSPSGVESDAKVAERSVTLPLTPESDGRRRPATAIQTSAERPIMQLLTLGLLIAMVVLISAAIGLVIGRWMTQR